jgi:N-acetyl-anhydromuramyl-L-alanine amidase AmpD
MNRLIFTFLLLFTGLAVRAQRAHDVLPVNNYTAHFNEAYQLHPELPRGILEGVAFINTRFENLDASTPESCMGLPRAYGIFGLTADGKNYFRNNLQNVARRSGFDAAAIQADPRTHILAYAAAFAQVMQEHLYKNEAWALRSGLQSLSELPADQNKQNQYALSSFVYAVLQFMNDEHMAASYGFAQHNYNLSELFGAEDFRILTAPTVKIANGKITGSDGAEWRGNSNTNPNVQSPDYPPALWNPAATCNYSSRNGTQISAVTIHTVQGSYAGCISWFQNCAASVSAHYVVRSSDGQVTQMVYESSKAWHVGSENPYTVGIEHEGYVTNPAWYTTAMYTSSAALTLDICNSNGINELRTGWWPWLPTTYYNQSSIPGACTKVKGHQHYPNQTHNDPGVNWDWDYYFRLINPAPAATVYTTASGTLYDSGGSAGNYLDDERSIWTISPVNATNVTLTFNTFNLENTWDYVFIYDGADINAPLIGYYTGTNNPGTITSSGGSVTVEFISDCATTAPGWDAVWNSSINTPPNTDVTAPSTQVSVSGTWQTATFNASFTESDNVGGSGLEKSFYQVIDFDGTDWRANNTRGFFSDNFDLTTIHPDWTAMTGTWAINSSVLEQNDENLTNTNIYAPLTQNLSNKYLYNWAGKISGTGTNRRAGFHFFSDNSTLPNRGNGYFVWFRVDQSVLEFYEVTNDVFALMHSVPMTVNINQWYDWKVIYDRTSGEINVYQDNFLIGSWTDTTPYSNGNSVSFRSGNSNWQINNFKVYRSRFSNQPVSVAVGNCGSCDIRYQNTNPNTPAGRVKSIVRDTAYNLSTVAYQDVNVDWTAPSSVAPVNDGAGTDLDLTISSSTLEANWGTSTDPHSGFSRYWYAIGTAPCDSDVVTWTNNWGYDTAVVNTLSLQNGVTYYFSVRAENGAGLVSPCDASDGIYVDLTTALAENDPVFGMIQASGNPFTNTVQVFYQLKEQADVQLMLTDMLGQQLQLGQTEKSPGMHTLTVDAVSLGLRSGMYLLTIKAGNSVRTLKLIKQ